MATSKHIDKICISAIAIVLVLTILMMNGGALGITQASASFVYEESLFDASYVHTIDITMDDWDSFIETCENEEYAPCDVVVDGVDYGSIAIRAKGNTSLSSVSTMGSQRYSFKLEFDQYEDGKSLGGLDKLCLNNLIQDNTMMKDFIVYQMMADFGVDTPLCSFAYLTVNGEAWGLYLAVEGVEDSFLQRNYGSDTGELYKPDSLSFGGGRGNGKDFSMSDFDFDTGDFNFDAEGSDFENFDPENANIPSGDFGSFGGFGSGDDSQTGESAPSGQMPQMPDSSFTPGQMPQGGGFRTSGGTDSQISQTAFEMPQGDMQMPSGQMPQMPDSSSDAEVPEMPASGEDTDAGNSDRFGGFGGNMSGFSASGGDFQMPGNMAGGFSGMGSDDVKLKYIDDDPDSYSNIFSSAKTEVSSADETRLISALKNLSSYTDLENTLDMEEVLRYFVVHNFVCNGDSYTGSMIHNYYLHESDGKLSMIPWDYNLAFGTFQGGDASGTVNTSIDSPVSGGSVDDRPMVGWIFSDEAYTEAYHQLFAEFISEWFDTEKLTTLISDTAEMIRPYVERDPTKFCTTEEFDTGVAALTEFVSLRAEAVTRQLSGDSTAVDTGNLNLSDMGSMGSMGSTMGGGGFGGGTQTESGNSSAPSAPTQEQPAGETGSKNSGISGGMPDDAFSQTGSDSSALILLGVSVLVLLIGLFIALKKKPNH